LLRFFATNHFNKNYAFPLEHKNKRPFEVLSNPSLSNTPPTHTNKIHFDINDYVSEQFGKHFR
jgi:hypothetical protein